MSILTLNNKVRFDNSFVFPVHKFYNKWAVAWQQIRDALDGEDTVKLAGERYLPRLSAQKEADYESYKTRAVFLNMTDRILNTNIGTIVRRTPTFTDIDEMKDYFASDNIEFLSFIELFKFIIREVGGMGRVGIAVDIKNDLPVPVRYTTENILNWIFDDEGNIESILLASSDDVTDPFTFETTIDTKYMRLHIDADGFYAVETYDGKGESIGTVNPSLRGKKLNFIPFVPITPFGIDIEPVKPPIYNVMKVNYSHYRTSADLETGRHFVGLPQPIITGAKADGDIYVGSAKALVLPSDKANAFYMEFLGQGLEGLSKALKEKESQMAQFSAQLVDTSTRGSEAEGTVRLRYSSDAANLSDIASSAELGLNRVYNYIATWLDVQAPSIELNKDFLSDKLTFNELKQLTQSWLDGGLTDEEYRYNLYRGEMLPPKK